MKINLSKVVLGTALALGATLSAVADDKLVVNGTDGSKTEHAISEIARIKFDGSRMLVTTTTGDKEYQIDAIARLTFDLVSTANAEIKASLDDLTVEISGGILTVTSAKGAPVDIRLFNLQGHAVAAVKSDAAASFDLNTLTKGVYIVKANNKVIKLTR